MQPAMLHLFVLALAGTALFQSASAQEKSKEPTDPAKLEGTWLVTSGESGGTKFGAADLGGMKVTFQGKRVRWEQQGSDPVESTFKLDPAKDPKWIDFGGKAPVGKKAPAGQSGVGIYKFQGDKLYLHIAVPRQDARPKDFTSRMGVISTVYVLERVAKSSQ